MKDFDLTHAKTRELLTLYSRIMKQLRKQGVVRSGNNPVADYSEELVARALNLTRFDRSFKGCDAEDSNRKKYEIKGRRITEDTLASRQ